MAREFVHIDTHGCARFNLHIQSVATEKKNKVYLKLEFCVRSITPVTIAIDVNISRQLTGDVKSGVPIIFPY